MFVPFKIKKSTIDAVCSGYKYNTDAITQKLKSNINFETIKQHFINGTQLQEEWFPTKCYDSQFQVFISHAHKDFETVSGLAGFLYKEYGLRSFIDSVYWGYIAELLLDLNNYYSSVVRDGREVFDYHTGNFLSAKKAFLFDRNANGDSVLHGLISLERQDLNLLDGNLLPVVAHHIPELISFNEREISREINVIIAHHSVKQNCYS